MSSGSGIGAFSGAVLKALRCPLCGELLELLDRTLVCPHRHSFDIAKQGYVNLLHAGIPAGTADTADMVLARTEFLAAGHYAPLATEIARQAKNHNHETPEAGLVIDAGAGTGDYLARVLDELPNAAGLAMDVSALALRKAAKRHPRMSAAVWNLWHPWPVATQSAQILLNIFAPRNSAEFHRVLAPNGLLIVVSPRSQHLGELVAKIDMLTVGEDKEQRLDATLADRFELVDRTECTLPLTLSPEDIQHVVRMGPSAHHLDKHGLRAQLDAVQEPLSVTAAFLISTYRPRRLNE